MERRKLVRLVEAGLLHRFENLLAHQQVSGRGEVRVARSRAVDWVY